LTFRGLYTQNLTELKQLALVAVIVGTTTYWFFDPVLEWVRRRGSSAPEAPPQQRSFVTTAIIVGATILISALDHSLGKGLEGLFNDLKGATGWEAAVVALGSFGLAAGIVTHYWGHGVQRRPTRAAAYGAKAGALAGALVGALVVLVLYLNGKIPPPPAGNPPAAHYAGFLIGAVGLPTLLWFGPGLLGGMAIDKRWGRVSPTRGILYALAGLSGLLLILALAVWHIFPLVWLLVAQLILQNLGWGFGPFLQRESCDPRLDPTGTLASKPPRALNQGGVVVPIRPPREGSVVPPGPDDQQAPPSPPQVLLLRPTGSRAWALVVLLIALALGGWAYATGYFKTDPQIESEIEAKFQQDSGLHKKSLSVHSADKVVTIAGSVDDAIQHTAAVQESSSVRGVKQLIDQLQVTPPRVAKPTVQTNTNTVFVPVLPPVVPPPPAINVNISPLRPGGQGPVRPATKLRPPAPPQAADAQKHKGFFHFLKRDKSKDKKDKTKNSPAP
jgi:hypothetical protein